MAEPDGKRLHADQRAYRAWRERTVMCPECQGTGMDRRGIHWSWCNRCQGSGRIEREECG
jgi:DnaJ-class molecular chaperone